MSIFRRRRRSEQAQHVITRGGGGSPSRRLPPSRSQERQAFLDPADLRFVETQPGRGARYTRGAPRLRVTRPTPESVLGRKIRATVLGQTKAPWTAPERGMPVRVPERVKECVARKERREVLFALERAGYSGSAPRRHYIRKESSNWRC